MKTVLLAICITIVTCFAYAETTQRLGQAIGQLAQDELTAQENLKQLHDNRIELIGRFKERVEADKELEALWKEIEALKKGKIDE